MTDIESISNIYSHDQSPITSEFFPQLSSCDQLLCNVLATFRPHELGQHIFLFSLTLFDHFLRNVLACYNFLCNVLACYNFFATCLPATSFFLQRACLLQLFFATCLLATTFFLQRACLLQLFFCNVLACYNFFFATCLLATTGSQRPPPHPSPTSPLAM